MVSNVKMTLQRCDGGGTEIRNSAREFLWTRLREEQKIKKRFVYLNHFERMHEKESTIKRINLHLNLM